jgi:hypothetical protein
MIMASTGITQFCLDTMDSQMDATFQSLLQHHFCRKEHLHGINWEQADDQLRKSSFAVTGYFLPSSENLNSTYIWKNYGTKYQQWRRPIKISRVDGP